MRIFLAALATMALSGCLEHGSQGAAVPAPKITFRLDSLAEFEQAGRRAADWCRHYHGRDARFVESKAADDNDAVTFECRGD
jgi:hypothetical protein